MSPSWSPELARLLVQVPLGGEGGLCGHSATRAGLGRQLGGGGACGPQAWALWPLVEEELIEEDRINRPDCTNRVPLSKTQTGCWVLGPPRK